MSEGTIKSVDVDTKEMKEFWYSLFPESNDKMQLSGLLNAISDKSEDDYIKRYIELESEKDEYIEEIFTVYESSNYKKDMECLITHLYHKCRWIYFFEPVLGIAFEPIKAMIENNSIIEDKSVFLEHVMFQLVQKLVNASYRTIVQEITLTKNEGRLKGNDSKERNQYFTDTLLKDQTYLKDTYKSYSELVRILLVITTNTIEFLKEILTQTETEMKQINQIFFSGNQGLLREIEMGKGDTHNHGKTVCRLVFTHGILIYKPRDLGMEDKFHLFLDWLKNVNPELQPIYAAKVHNIGNSGWMEFIENEECKSEQEVSDFYYRMGELLCILYTFSSKDFHCENVVAKGASPVLIDLETLFSINMEFKIEDVYDSIIDSIRNSVVGTALLPTLLPNNNTEEVIEIGALGSGKQRVSPFKTHVLKNFDSDEISIEMEQRVLPNEKNFPILEGNCLGCEMYLNEIREGFRTLYIWIMNHNELYCNKVKELFETERCRVICKNTSVYTQLLTTSNHPSLLYNKVDREVYFHRLGLLIPNIEEFNEKLLYQLEIELMLNEDIPMFYVYMNRTDIMYGNDETFGMKCTLSAMEETENKIEAMNEIDLSRQIALINTSFFGSKLKIDLKLNTNLSFENHKEIYSDSERREIVSKVANLCCERALQYKNEIGFIGMMGFGDNYSKINPAGNYLYNGNAGIAIFLLESGSQLKNEHYIEFGNKALNSVKHDLCKKIERGKVYSYGAFDGMLGEIYLLTYGVNKKRIKLDEVKEIFANSIELISNHLDEIKRLDIIAGLSGVLGVILMLYQLEDFAEKEACIQVAGHIVDELLSCAKEQEDGTINWFENEDIGYAHGNAGVMTQLCRYYELTKEFRVIPYIQKALQFERIHKYDEQNETWIIRENSRYYSWCNGIAGLLLCKIELLKVLKDDCNLKREMNTIIEQLKKIGFGDNGSICHGDIGSVSIIQYAAEFLHDEILYQQCEAFKDAFRKCYVLDNWSMFEGIEDWGLMTGVAGIGLGLLEDFHSVVDVLYLK